jgi:hypothetical protein
MPISPVMVAEMNGSLSNLSLSPRRVEELAIELSQLASAIERVRERLRFDGEPLDFTVALLDVSKDESDA